MSIETKRFIVKENDVMAVARNDTVYTVSKGNAGDKAILNHYLDVYLFERQTISLDYEEDKESRDADYEAVAAVLR